MSPLVPASEATTPIADLFARVVSALRISLQFDHAELDLFDDPETVRILAFDVDVSASPAVRGASRDHFSHWLWPPADETPLCVGDASSRLDRECAEDRRLLEDGMQSILALPLRVGDRRLGRFALASRAGELFGPSHLAALVPIVELLAVAAESARLWEIESRRQMRRARLDALLPTIAEALDVRQVFLGMSQVIQDIVPHDVMAFALLTPDRGGVQIQAATLAGLREMPEYRFTNEEEALDSNWRFLLAHDLTPVEPGVLRARISPRDAPEAVDVLVRPGLAWTQFVAAAGVRSTLRVPIRAHGRPIGGLAFFSRQPYAYSEEDGELASRIADHVALALAHQELAEEAKAIAQAEERATQLEARVTQLTSELDRFSAHRALGQSAKWRQILADVAQVAPTDTTVLVTGETGTGKEVVARAIHRGSARARGPFVAINCAALPEQLLESELFGHERGAFTGALAARAGKIEQAAGGVLFLDEVGEMTPPVQAKFLRVLQEREFQRLGGARTLRADVRVVAATNRDPRRAMESGAFREDLYYRLSVFEIYLPPLRDRADDILVLAEAFLEEIASGVGRPAAGISEDARQQLLAYAWPGNVRELRNAMERAVILCNGGLITRDHLPMTLARSVAAATAEKPAEPLAAALTHEAVERELLLKALAQTRNNKTQAARLLNLSRGHFYTLLRRHGLTDARR
jgi:formate hydrogenlyase transcriptional activator